MIHYTLLPEKEIKSLKKEYRTRLFITLLFFVSCSVVFGVLALIPAYIFSYSQDKQVMSTLKDLQNKRHENGADVILQELNKDNAIIQKLKNSESTNYFSNVISTIISYKTSPLKINSFQISELNDASSTKSLDIVVQGKSLNREALIAFKNKLEADPLVSKVELPISDLAKNKDISFSIKFSIIQSQ